MAIEPLVIRIQSQIDLQVCFSLENAIQDEILDGSTDVTIAFNCIGGDPDIALNLYDFLRDHSTDIHLTTCNLGQTNSAAVIVYLAGDSRIVDLNATFVLHPLTYRLNGSDFTRDDLTGFIDDLDTRTDRYRVIIPSRTKMQLPEVEQTFRFECPYDANAAVIAGIAHGAMLVDVPDMPTLRKLDL